MYLDERFKSSNIGYGLLGLVIEAAAGMPYHDSVDRHILDRLGLRDTGPETDDRARSRLVTGFTKPRLGLPRRPLRDVATRSGKKSYRRWWRGRLDDEASSLKPW